ncbi:hypothetical protein BD626DRAFT_482529 [Schizophyllum amplum]|uniref:Secreted protein n=1 Tax=Schizophyllum amplum TaxID=97359 RepID=A0A550CV98_9AGAR|nr:hypothetical protein BD626DRAFT_482529 [Auriculariopsis ampla]
MTLISHLLRMVHLVHALWPYMGANHVTYQPRGTHRVASVVVLHRVVQPVFPQAKRRKQSESPPVLECTISLLRRSR